MLIFCPSSKSNMVMRWAQIFNERAYNCCIVGRISCDCDSAWWCFSARSAGLIVSNLRHWLIFWPLWWQCRDDSGQHGASVTRQLSSSACWRSTTRYNSCVKFIRIQYLYEEIWWLNWIFNVMKRWQVIFLSPPLLERRNHRWRFASIRKKDFTVSGVPSKFRGLPQKNVVNKTWPQKLIIWHQKLIRWHQFKPGTKN